MSTSKPPMNSANYPTLIGPVKCPSCGWDDDGERRDEQHTTDGTTRQNAMNSRYRLSIEDIMDACDGCGGLRDVMELPGGLCEECRRPDPLARRHDAFYMDDGSLPDEPTGTEETR